MQQRFESSGLERVATDLIGDQLSNQIQQAAISVINFEGPVASNAAPIKKSGPPTALDMRCPSLLKTAGFTTVTLANNHILDYSIEGLDKTIAACKNAGLSIVGVGKQELEALRPLRLSAPGGIRVSLFAVAEKEFNVATATSPGAAWISHPLLLQLIKDETSQADIIVVIAHGGIEETPYPPMQRQSQLRKIIDAGANVVVGHHPHVPQGWEVYKSGIIFYSLGNFLFEYTNGVRYPKTEWGLAVELHYQSSRLLSVELIPVETVDGTVDVMTDSHHPETVLEYLFRLSEALQDEWRTQGLWQETALYVWNERYAPWLASVWKTSLRPSIKSSTKQFLHALRTRLFDSNATYLNLDETSSLLLLNTIQNESHRWAMETAVGMISGIVPDVRTPELHQQFIEDLKWTV